jgi:uncharacterized protein
MIQIPKSTFAAVLWLITASVFSQSTENSSVQIDGIPFPLTWETKPVDFKVNKNSISIKAGKETDFYSSIDGSYYETNAPKILFKPDSNFIFSAKIKPDFKNIYDGGALFIYADTVNWAKVLFEMHNDKSVALGISVVHDKRGDDSYHGHITGDEVYVKVARSGKVFNFYQSPDGKTWTLTRTFPFDKKSELRIGFYAQSPKGESCTVNFSDITYKGVKIENILTGE